MDSAISTAARALSVGDPLQALKFVALRADAPALALRGIAMAQLGELAHARTLLRRAATSFGMSEPAARARCVVAQAEIALALRDLPGAARGLEEAATLLEHRGDADNALFARLVQARRLALLGEVQAAEAALQKLSLARAPARLTAIAALVAADLAMKRVDSEAAARSLERARSAAHEARIVALAAEVERLEHQLAAPVARLLLGGQTRTLALHELPAVFRAGDLLVDACRREVRLGKRVVKLVRRPILLELLVALGEAAPREAPRDALIARVFGARRVSDSHRVRLRVEIGRLRKLLVGLARLEATSSGFLLAPEGARRVALLLPPTEGEASALFALLRGGEAWATSALAAAVGKSQRAVQRALAGLEEQGRVRATGEGRARRWVASPVAGFAMTLLLVAPGTLG
jgi:hypothetical protein